MALNILKQTDRKHSMRPRPTAQLPTTYNSTKRHRVTLRLGKSLRIEPERTVLGARINTRDSPRIFILERAVRVDEEC